MFAVIAGRVARNIRIYVIRVVSAMWMAQVHILDHAVRRILVLARFSDVVLDTCAAKQKREEVASRPLVVWTWISVLRPPRIDCTWCKVSEILQQGQ